MSFICLQCEKEFTTLPEQIAHTKTHYTDVVEPPKREVIVEKVEKNPLPIVLKYIYEGQCPVCLRTVDTLEVLVNDKLNQVAFCFNCKKQLIVKQVTPIS